MSLLIQRHPITKIKFKAIVNRIITHTPTIMPINFIKIKSQIHPFKPEVKKGYIFIATDQQKNDFIDSIAEIGSKRSLIRLVVQQIQQDEDYKAEFLL